MHTMFLCCARCRANASCDLHREKRGIAIAIATQLEEAKMPRRLATYAKSNIIRTHQRRSPGLMGENAHNVEVGPSTNANQAPC